MALDPFRREIPPEHGVTPDWRAMIENFSASVGAIVTVTNDTDKAQLVSDMVAAGHAPSASRPLYVHRQDAANGLLLEYTTDGSTWTPVGGVTEVTITWQANRYTPAGFAKPKLFAHGNKRTLAPGAIGSSIAFTQGNLALGTIPAGHRPAEAVRAAASSASSGVADPMIEVNPAGAISYVWLATVTMSANTYCVGSAVEWLV